MNDYELLLFFKLFERHWFEGDHCRVLVGVFELEHEVNVVAILLRLELADAVDRYFRDVLSHLEVDSQRFFLRNVDVWHNDFLLALPAPLDSLGQELQLEWVQVCLLSWLSLQVVKSLLQRGHFVDVEVLGEGFI